MKKVGIIILIIILICFTIALCNILLFSIRNNQWNWFMSFRNMEEIRKEEYIIKQEKIDIAGIEKIKIDVNSSGVNVFLTDENEIKVIQYSAQELKDNEIFNVDKNSSNIAITKKIDKGFHFFYINQTIFDIYIPKQYEKSLEIKEISGDIRTEDNMKFENLEIYSTSGDVEMPDIEASNINIETVSGNIKIDTIKNNEVKLKSVSGDIIIERIEGKVDVDTTSGEIKLGSIKGDINAKTTSGDIEIEEIEAKIELISTSGDIKSDNLKITGKSKIKTISGDVKMYLNEESNCQIRTKTTSGNVALPDGRNVIGTEPLVELDIETTSGNMKLEKRK